MTDPITICLPDVHGNGAETIKEIILKHVPADKVTIRTFSSEPTSTAEWIERTEDADGIMLGWKLPYEALLAAGQLKAVSFLGTGIADQISLPTCDARSIATYVVSGYGDNAVAEHTIALLYSVWNSVPQLNSDVHAGSWPELTRTELLGSTLGIVGYGGIGRRVAEVAEAIGMRVLVYSRSLNAGDSLPQGTAATLDEVLSQSDAITLHLALRPDTRHFIDSDSFKKMKHGVVFLNTSRADIVDNEALGTALRSGRLRGAGVDVFSPEPVDPGNPLLGISQAVLTPHIGYNTDNAVAALMRLGTLNLIRHFWPEHA